MYNLVERFIDLEAAVGDEEDEEEEEEEGLGKFFYNLLYIVAYSEG
jgi:hypothetical protein